MKNKSNLFLFVSVILILLAVALVAILDKTVPTGSSIDVRARAGTQNALKLVGVVASVNEAKGTVELTGVQFADTNRAGAPQNLGDWTVTAPTGFNFASVTPGTAITMGIDVNTFNIKNHTVIAITLTTEN
ncbi:MAG: hypothetical protein NTY06_02150 [Candidatus Gottesmanbacteria bacterium]|nr:hypothetical protein [Candidatus Gottesmanbacteria bacterium]